MMEWTWLTWVLIGLLLAEFKLDWLASLLNLRAFPRNETDWARTGIELPSATDDSSPAERIDRARDYHQQHARLDTIERCFMLAVLLLFWMLGGFQQLDTWVRATLSSPLSQGMVFCALLLLGQSLLHIPFQWLSTFRIEQQFGFNRATQTVFATDTSRNLLLLLVLGAPLGMAILWIFLHIPHAWLWAWGVFSGFQLLMLWLAPSVILPLFNRFTPMPAGPLRERIEALAKSCNYPLSGVFVMDGSKRSSKANAFFTGFGKHKKIALFDTLIDSCSEDELLAVLAHEIGHDRCGHIRQRLVLSLIQSAGMFFLLGVCTDPHSAAARALFDAFGVTTISPHVGLVLFSIMIGPFARLWGIPLHAWSRRHEFEADAFAVRAVGSAASLTSALGRLHRDQLGHPCPAGLRVWLDYSHPPLAERLERMRQAMPPTA